MAFSANQASVIKGFDCNIKYLIHGFIRDAQNLLPLSENSYYIIPELIIMTCLLYYHWFMDEWDPKNMGDNMEILYDNVLKITSGYAQSTFLLNIVQVSKYSNYEWRFQLIQYLSSTELSDYNICVGLWNIDENDYQFMKTALNDVWTQDDIDWNEACPQRYGIFFSNGYEIVPDEVHVYSNNDTIQCKQHDIIEMKLVGTELLFRINDEKGRTMTINKTGNYKAAIYAQAKWSENILIQLLPNDDNQQKHANVIQSDIYKRSPALLTK